MLSRVALLPIIASLLAVHGKVLMEQENMDSTVYYDLTLSTCGEITGAGPAWAAGINEGIPFCEGQNANTLTAGGSDAVVALARNVVGFNPEIWCGKEVQIIGQDGEPMKFDVGDLYIWDGCEACVDRPIIDLSALVVQQLKGGDCGSDSGNNVKGLHIRVTDKQVKAYDGTAAVMTTSGEAPGLWPGQLVVGGEPVVAGAIGDSKAPTSQAAVAPEAASTSSSPAPTALGETGHSGVCSTKGEARCTGNQLEYCNYIGSPAALGWQANGPPCATYCDVSKTPMCG